MFAKILYFGAEYKGEMGKSKDFMLSGETGGRDKVLNNLVS